jgi:hypothetical protein
MKFLKARTFRSPGLVFKCFVFLFFSLFINTFIESQQILFNIGDNILDYLNRNPTQYLNYGDFFANTPDGRIDFLKYKVETSEADTKFLVQGSTVFGVMQYENNATALLYDITGDGVLDVRLDFLFMPFWVLSESSLTNISGNNNLLQFLNNGQRMFNGNDNPNANGGMTAYITMLSSRIDVSTENRDLFFGMLEYYSFAQYPALALMLISELAIRYEERFGSTHPLLLLHTAESLINLGNIEYAVIFINDLLSVSPDFVPAKVYSWQLERDPAIKQRKYTELKTNHPNHWIVRQI